VDNDKVYDLMEKLYVEMQHGFKEVNGKISDLEKEIIKTNLTIEHDIKPKIEVLFDGQKQTSDKLDRLDSKVDNLENRFDHLDNKVDRIESKIDRIEVQVSKHDELIMTRIK